MTQIGLVVTQLALTTTYDDGISKNQLIVAIETVQIRFFPSYFRNLSCRGDDCINIQRMVTVSPLQSSPI